MLRRVTQHLTNRAVYGGLGRPTQAGEATARDLRGEPARQIRTYPVTSQDDRAQGIAQLTPAHCQNHVEQSRHTVDNRNPMSPYQFHPCGGLGPLRGVHRNHGGADREHAEDVVYGQIELEGRQSERTIRGDHFELIVQGVNRVHSGRM